MVNKKALIGNGLVALVGAAWLAAKLKGTDLGPVDNAVQFVANTVNYKTGLNIFHPEWVQYAAGAGLAVGCGRNFYDHARGKKKK